MNKLSYYKTFKKLCADAKFKEINLREYGLGAGETVAWVVTLDEGHSIAISIEAYEYRDSANDSECLELNFSTRMTDVARTFKNGLNYFYTKN